MAPPTGIKQKASHKEYHIQQRNNTISNDANNEKKDTNSPNQNDRALERNLLISFKKSVLL